MWNILVVTGSHMSGHLSLIIPEDSRHTEYTNFRHTVLHPITNSDLNRPCFAWHPNGKSGLFKTESVIACPLITPLPLSSSLLAYSFLPSASLFPDRLIADKAIGPCSERWDMLQAVCDLDALTLQTCSHALSTFSQYYRGCFFPLMGRVLFQLCTAWYRVTIKTV